MEPMQPEGHGLTNRDGKVKKQPQGTGKSDNLLRITLSFNPEQSRMLHLIQQRRQYPTVNALCRRIIEKEVERYSPKRESDHKSPRLVELETYFRRFTSPTSPFLKQLIREDRLSKDKAVKAKIAKQWKSDAKKRFQKVEVSNGK